MRRTTTVVIGAGQAGLAVSRHLTGAAVDHVLLERGRVAESWRGRWDSLRLLTPNWMSRLPGYCYQGDDPEGYMTAAEAAEYVAGFASAIAAPVETGIEVTSVTATGDGFRVETTGGDWVARSVVVASGPYARPDLPAAAADLPAGIESLTLEEYRNPEQLDQGGALIVGAGASGVQLAEEVQQSGRPVTLAVGHHVRMPREYRGMDIMWWLDNAGVFDERADEVDDVVRARHVASFQLVGSDPRRTVDLNTLQRLGVRIVGRLGGVSEHGTAQFSGSLANVCTLADLKLSRLLDTLDEWAFSSGVDREIEPPRRLHPTRVPDDPVLMLRLRAAGVRTVIWATGYRPHYPWLRLPVLDAKGAIVHEGGVTPVPGLYVIGTPLLRSRRSTFIDGVGEDARFIAEHLVGHLNQVTTPS